MTKFKTTEEQTFLLEDRLHPDSNLSIYFDSYKHVIITDSTGAQLLLSPEVIRELMKIFLKIKEAYSLNVNLPAKGERKLFYGSRLGFTQVVLDLEQINDLHPQGPYVRAGMDGEWRCYHAQTTIPCVTYKTQQDAEKWLQKQEKWLQKQ